MKTTTIRLAATLLVLLFTSQMVQGQDKDAGGDKPVVAVFSLNGPVTEAPAGDDFPFGSVGGESLKDLVERMKKAKPDIMVMHPGPINRGLEMESEVADGRNSVILEQVTNGVAVRMAVLYLLSGGEAPENKSEKEQIKSAADSEV